jgi:hypothetical protein
MGEDEAALLRLWREKRGEVEPEDLSDNLIVQLGNATEDLNRRWFEGQTGLKVKDVQRRVRHPVNRWMGATLDGVVGASGAVYEAKFMLPWSFSEEGAAEKHMAQLQHNMWVINRQRGLPLHHHGRRQVGSPPDRGRPAIPAPPSDRRAQVLAMRRERGDPAPIRGRGALPPH